MKWPAENMGSRAAFSRSRKYQNKIVGSLFNVIILRYNEITNGFLRSQKKSNITKIEKCKQKYVL